MRSHAIRVVGSALNVHGSVLSPPATLGGDAPNVWSVRHIIIPVGRNKR